MKSKLRFFLFIVLLVAFAFSACTKPQTIEEEPELTERPRPAITPNTQKTRQPGDKFDIDAFFVQCQVDSTKQDMKKIWKVYMPTESPDPSWTIESVDGDTVTYSKITCNHETPIPEGTADLEAADDVAEATPTPEG